MQPRVGQVTLDTSVRTCCKNSNRSVLAIFFLVRNLSVQCHLGPSPQNVAGVEGLEPPTPGFGDRCSSQLSYTPIASPWIRILHLPISARRA